MELPEYKKEDFKQLSWEEYGKTMEVLYKKVQSYVDNENIKIDAVVPILRGAGIVGTYLAYKLKLLRILPVQYKYLFDDGKVRLKQILDLPKVDLPNNPVFLLVEDNHCFGETANIAARDLMVKYPKATILYAANHLDVSHQNSVKDAKVTFYGMLTDETREAKDSSENSCKVGQSYLAPWETIEEEWDTVKLKQFDYENVESISKKAVTKKEF